MVLGGTAANDLFEAGSDSLTVTGDAGGNNIVNSIYTPGPIAGNGRIESRVADLSRIAAAETLASSVTEPIDVLINNAGVAVSKGVLEQTEADWPLSRKFGAQIVALLESAAAPNRRADRLEEAFAGLGELDMLAGKGFDHVIIAHSDLPLATSFAHLCRPGTVTLVPDRMRDRPVYRGAFLIRLALQLPDFLRPSAVKTVIIIKVGILGHRR